jgi:hypothetical protein
MNNSIFGIVDKENDLWLGLNLGIAHISEFSISVHMIIQEF